MERLLSAGFPKSVVAAVAVAPLRKLKGSAKRKRADLEVHSLKPEVLPYEHTVSHDLKKVADGHGVTLVFSAPNKLALLCPRTTKAATKKGKCSKKHATPYVRCAEQVVYDITSTRGKSCIGQTCHMREIKKKVDGANLSSDYQKSHVMSFFAQPKL